MRILHISLDVSETSAEYNEHILPLSAKYNISVCSYFAPFLTHSKNIKLFAGDSSLFGFFKALRQAIKNNNYDIIHSHSPHVGFLFILACFLLKPKLLNSTVHTVHSSYPNYKFRNRLMLIWIFIFFRRIVCCSHASYTSFTPFFKWLAGKRLKFVPNGVNIERIDKNIKQSQSLKISHDFTIISVGRLIDLKRPFVLLKAFHKSCKSQGQLIFIGEGHLQKPLLLESQRLGIKKRVIFTGLAPREKVYQCLSKADLFVSPSSIEGLPVAVMEAMACRLPVILSDIPAHREITGGTEFIPLIPVNDVKGFVEEIHRICKMSKKNREALGKKCRKIVEDRFGLSSMQNGYKNIYLEIISRNNC